nr:hypothetical protein [Streptomyces sp. NRRL B-24085]
MLDSLPYAHRYAWFGLGADPSKPSSGLFTDGTTTTTAGRALPGGALRRSEGTGLGGCFRGLR